jgi:hypothetical protein
VVCLIDVKLFTKFKKNDLQKAKQTENRLNFNMLPPLNSKLELDPLVESTAKRIVSSGILIHFRFCVGKPS